MNLLPNINNNKTIVKFFNNKIIVKTKISVRNNQTEIFYKFKMYYHIL